MRPEAAVEYESSATLTIAGDEVDVPVRARMRIEPGFVVMVDGEMEVQWDGRWVDFDDFGIDARDRDRVEEQFADIAFEDR